MADINGTPGNDNLFGTPDDDTFHGNGGDDSMFGLAGNDTYYVEDSGDDVFENGREGLDTVFALASYVLNQGSSVEFLTADPAAGSAPINLTGNHLSNTVTGNGGANILHGGGGSDMLIGLGGDDTYYTDVSSTRLTEHQGGGNDALYVSVSYSLETAGEVELLSANDYLSLQVLNLTGNFYGQTIIGNAGPSIINGGGGVDLLIGLGGNDLYYVDIAATRVIEYEGGGNDQVYVSVSYILGGGEVETLSTNNRFSTEAINLTGNVHGQSLVGNAGANILNGGGGADLLFGLGGNDIYYVDVAAAQIVEYESGGSDTVYVSLSYALGGSAEVETLSANDYGSTAAINLTGNLYSQTIVGNAGANVLHGGGGVDTLIGLGGNDTYYVDVAGTQISEAGGGGADAIYTSVSFALAAGSEVEILSTNNYGATDAVSLTGNSSSQVVTGNAGANTLNGGAGADTLYGLGGADNFAFTTALGGGNVDYIADFSVADDSIALDDAIFAGIGTAGAFNSNAFHTGAAAHDLDDRVVYNSATGQLFYDADGNGAGAAVQFATLAGNPALTASDFQAI